MSNLPTKLSFGFFRSLLWKSNWVKFCGENVRKNCGKTVHFGMISPQKPWKSIVASFLLKKWSKNSGFLPNFSSKALKKLCVLCWISTQASCGIVPTRKMTRKRPDFSSETLKKCAFLARFLLWNSEKMCFFGWISTQDSCGIVPTRKMTWKRPDFSSEMLKKVCIFGCISPQKLIVAFLAEFWKFICHQTFWNLPSIMNSSYGRIRP